jgi:hypothetical protein
MLTENDLRELVDFNPTAPVLSLYLNSDPTEGNTDAHKLRARSMISTCRKTLRQSTATWTVSTTGRGAAWRFSLALQPVSCAPSR